MLRFVVFDQDGPASDFAIRHAHLFGTDDVPIQGEVRFEGGLIVCDKTAKEAAGLSLQFEPGAITADDATVEFAPGLLTLRTCLLPSSEEPYLLALELARHRIMLFLNKLEDWQLVDLPTDHPVLVLFERARATFTRALVAQREPNDEHGNRGGYAWHADQLSRASLTLAIEASEQLAKLYAERMVEQRATNAIYRKAVEIYTAAASEAPPADVPIIVPSTPGVVMPGRPQVGVSVGPQQFDENLQRVLSGSMDFITMPMRWRDMEPKEGSYSFGPTDRWIEWAVRKAKLPVTAGPVIDFRRSCIPEWIYIWENDYETLRDVVYEHMKHIVTRYRRTVKRWTVASGLHVNTNFTFSFDQMMDLTRVCVLMVRKLHPSARVQLEITQPWGEYYSYNRRSRPPMLYAEMVSQAGISVDSYALRLQCGSPSEGLSTRDLASVSDLLDRYAQRLEKPISVTCVGAPSKASAAQADALEPGYWRSPWSEPQQADWAKAFLEICAGKPYVHGVCWQDVIDHDPPESSPEMPFGGLLGADGMPKPVAGAVAGLRKQMREMAASAKSAV